MKNKFIFSFTSAGLFSEINNFLLALLYAHKNNLEIVIDYYSLKAIDELTLNKILNLTLFLTNKSIIFSKASTRSLNTYLYGYSGIAKYFQIVKYYTHILKYKIYSEIFSQNIDLLQKHWSGIRELRLNLSIDDKLFLFGITKNLWIHQGKVNDKKNANYIGVHIRRGDKITETKFILLNDYLDEIINQCEKNCTNKVFIFTDLKEEGVKLKKSLSGYNVILNYMNENGYYHEEFIKLPNDIKASKSLLLCDIVNELVASTHYVGSNDANLSSFVTLLRGGKNVTDLRKGGVIIY